MNDLFQRFCPGLHCSALFCALLVLCAALSSAELPLLSLDENWVMKIGDNPEWAQLNWDDSDWREISVGVPWEQCGFADYNGFAWYRVEFVAPKEWQELVQHDFISLSLGVIDDADMAYVNGAIIGATGSMPPTYQSAYDLPRKYRIPTKLIRWGEPNLLAVRVYDGDGDGGIVQGPVQLHLPDFEELLDIRFHLDSDNGIYYPPAPISLTMIVKNLAATDCPLQIISEWTGDRVDSVQIFETHRVSAIAQADSEVSLKFVFSPPSPGFYRAVFTINEQAKKSIVLGFDPEKRTTPLTRPPDFVTFWQQRKQELAQVDPEFTMIRSDRSTDQVNVYLVEMKSYGQVRIRAWYTVPTNNAPHPAILTLPGYTSTLWPSVDRTKVATLALNPRSHGNSKDDVDPQDQEFMFIGFDPENPQLYIYAGVYMDCLRAVDFLASRPEIDASRIGVEGASQGGGLAFATAALDSRIIFCAADIPWLGDWVGYLEAEYWGWANYPKLFALHPDLTFAKINQFLSYFDTMNMAEWISCPVLMSVGLQDKVCPPRIAFSVYNALTTDKSFVVYPFTGHSVTREHEKLKDEWMAQKLGVDTLGQIDP